MHHLRLFELLMERTCVWAAPAQPGPMRQGTATWVGTKGCVTLGESYPFLSLNLLICTTDRPNGQ